jgi:hypothetical protein
VSVIAHVYLAVALSNGRATRREEGDKYSKLLPRISRALNEYTQAEEDREHGRTRLAEQRTLPKMRQGEDEDRGRECRQEQPIQSVRRVSHLPLQSPFALAAYGSG